jgi:hypothetical protein
MRLLSSVKDLNRTLDFARSRGANQIALCYFDRLPQDLAWWLRLNQNKVAALIQADGQSSAAGSTLGKIPLLSLELVEGWGAIDAVIVIDQPNFGWIMRLLEKVIQRGALILPANLDWVVPPAVVNLTQATAWRESVPVEYVARSGLTGHYLEFGTFWGRSFFPAYFRFRHWLQGDFYAFDSFQGLPKPQALETVTTGGDFREHTYNFGYDSFMALAHLLNVDTERLQVIPGFYSETLVGHDPNQYGLTPQSVSVCVIDCDLYESTTQVLEFVTPLLQTGSLLYFDDWRLCRASREVGERAAALHWLKSHPNFELVEVYRDHWQHQWFIFND